MAKIDKYTQARLDGMGYAFGIFKTKGAEALEKEIAMRKAVPVQLEVSTAKVNEIFDGVRDRLYNTIMTLAFKSLHDEFGFGKIRLQRFEKKINTDIREIAQVDPYGYRYLQFQDVAKEFNEKYGTHISMKEVVEADEMNSRYMDLRASIPAIVLLLEQENHHAAAGFLREFFDDKFEVKE